MSVQIQQNKNKELSTLQSINSLNKSQHMKNSQQRIITLEKETEKRHEKHLQRLDSISSPQKKAKSRLESNHSLHIHRSNPRQILQQQLIKAENDRLYKKLSQINNRRNSNWQKINQEENQYYTINQRSRQLHRKQKNLLIQNENNLFVERLLQKVGNSKSIITGQNRNNLKKSRKKSRSVVPSTLEV